MAIKLFDISVKARNQSGLGFFLLAIKLGLTIYALLIFSPTNF